MSEEKPQSELPSQPKPERQLQIPTGEAKRLHEFTREQWQKHLLLFSQVKNRVLEVNPNVNIPLKLTEGEPSPLGLFAEVAFQEAPGEMPEGKRKLEFWPAHQRSALLGRIVFEDKEGRFYRDIDLKGVGYLISEGDPRKAYVFPPGKGSESGLLNRDIAFFDRQMSEEFLQAGIRTHRVLAIIELEELISNGKKLSLDQAIKEGVIDEKFHPVVVVRAFGTKMRLEDFYRHRVEEKGELLLQDAKKLVSKELGRQDIVSDEEYLEWFAETFGWNVGLMHKNGWIHDYLFKHDITLDCRIVDLDDMEFLQSEKQRLQGFETTRDLFYVSLVEPLVVGDVKNLFKIFQKGYDAAFSPKERERYFEKVQKETQG